jgi:hypothetical protein
MKRQPYCSSALRIAFLAAIVALCCASAFAVDQYILPTAPSVAGASVFVDGTPAGMTDENGKIILSGITPGVHLLRLESGGETYAQEKTFDADLNSLLPFNVDESTRQPTGGPENVDYVIDANIAGADVAVDGVSQSPTDTAGRATLHLSAGQTYRIEIRKEGYNTDVETITAAAGGERKVVLQKHGETSTHRVDVPLIVLVVLLAGSLALLVAMLMRHRARTAAPAATVRVSAAVTEQTGGHFDRYQLISQRSHRQDADRVESARRAVALRSRHGAQISRRGRSSSRHRATRSLCSGREVLSLWPRA